MLLVVLACSCSGRGPGYKVIPLEVAPGRDSPTPTTDSGTAYLYCLRP